MGVDTGDTVGVDVSVAVGVVAEVVVGVVVLVGRESCHGSSRGRGRERGHMSSR